MHLLAIDFQKHKCTACKPASADYFASMHRLLADKLESPTTIIRTCRRNCL
jgi:hypothetical protein